MSQNRTADAQPEIQLNRPALCSRQIAVEVSVLSTLIKTTEDFLARRHFVRMRIHGYA